MLKPYTKAQINFSKIREIGSDGRNSKAWLANDPQLGAEIVIKRVLKSDIVEPALFFEEARVLYATAHQNVVQLHYACEDNNCIYLAMPFYEKGSMKGLMSAGHLTVREIVKLGCQMLSGLHNVHSKQLIHFDIKPDNVLLTGRGEALLSDFGLAKQMVLGLAEPDRMYTPMAPPEVLRGPPYDLRFDIYQIGLTLYRMCVGNTVYAEQLPKDASGHLDRRAFASMLAAGTFPDLALFPAHIPQRLRRVVTQCISADPDRRFQSALAVANALAAVEECLDWRYQEGGSIKTWTKNENGTIKRFTVTDSGEAKLVSITNGRERRISAGCKSVMQAREIVAVLKGH